MNRAVPAAGLWVVEEVFRRTRRMLHAWLAHADQRTLLPPDFLTDGQGRQTLRLGSERKDGVEITGPARWTVEKATGRAAA